MGTQQFKARHILRGLLAVLFLSVIVLLPSTASAQDRPKRGLSISPPVFELSANRGDTLTNTIRLDNLSEDNVEVSTELRNFTALGEKGQVSLSKDDTPFPLANWTKVTPAAATLAPKESKIFTFTITIPADGQPGGHFGSVVFMTKPSQSSDRTMASVSQELGSLVLLRVAGEATEELSIENFQTLNRSGKDNDSAKPTKVLPGGNIIFESRVANNGNVYLKPRGVITVNDIFGRKIGEFPLDSQNVLPQAVRRIETQWHSPFMFGRYTANISLAYGVNNEHIATASTSFWVVPYKNIPFLVGTATILILIVAGVKWRKRLSLAIQVLRGKKIKK